MNTLSSFNIKVKLQTNTYTKCQHKRHHSTIPTTTSKLPAICNSYTYSYIIMKSNPHRAFTSLCQSFLHASLWSQFIKIIVKLMISIGMSIDRYCKTLSTSTSQIDISTFLHSHLTGVASRLFVLLLSSTILSV